MAGGTEYDDRGRVGTMPEGDLYRLDTSGHEPEYVLATLNGKHIRLASLPGFVLMHRSRGATFEDIASFAKMERLGQHEPQAIASYHDQIIDRVRSVVDRRSNGGSGFILRATLVPAPIVRQLAAFSAFIYDRIPAVLLSLLIATSSLIWILERGPAPVIRPKDVLIGYVLFFLTLFVHEVGHAAASQRFGVAPGRIGATLYFIFPALFADVSPIWRLTRTQRVIVDLGGSYAQLACASPLVFSYVAWHSPSVYIAMVIVYTATIFNLNPVFRFDGYWLLSDALGVTNLGAQPIRLGKRLINRLAGYRQDPLPWPKGLVRILYGYSAVALAVWIYFLYRMAQVIAGLGSWVHTAIRILGHANLTYSVGFLFQSTSVFALFLVIISLLRRLFMATFLQVKHKRVADRKAI